MKSFKSFTSIVCYLLIAFLSSSCAAMTKTKDIKTSDGTKYVYDFAPATKDYPTILFLHGFPSTRQDWAHQVTYFTSLGYGIIAPDLLGYGDSDRPTNLEQYNLKNISAHLDEIISSEGVKSVIAVAHDWGTVVLSRSLYWHPERYERVAFLSTPYAPAGSFLDVDAINAAALESLGYAQYGYWYFFNSYDASDLIESRVSLYY